MSVGPRFSVVLPTRDRPERLEAAVDSVLEQTYPGFDLWIVDDGSGPETVAVCESWKASPRIHVLRNNTPQGAAAARNQAASRAPGEYLAMIDDDCVWHPERLKRIDRLLRGSGRPPSYVCTQTVAIDPGPPVSYEIDPVLLEGEEPWRVGAPMITVAREAFFSLGGFDERLPRGHDWDLAIRLVAGTDWQVLADPLAWTDLVDGLSDDPAKLERASRVLGDKYGRGSELPRALTVDFHTFFAHKLVTRGHWAEGLRHYGLAVLLAPTRLRGWLYLAAALPGPAIHRSLARAAARVRRGSLPDRHADHRSRIA